jgi:hypothetical protein
MSKSTRFSCNKECWLPILSVEPKNAHIISPAVQEAQLWNRCSDLLCWRWVEILGVLLAPCLQPDSLPKLHQRGTTTTLMPNSFPGWHWVPEGFHASPSPAPCQHQALSMNGAPMSWRSKWPCLCLLCERFQVTASNCFRVLINYPAWLCYGRIYKSSPENTVLWINDFSSGLVLQPLQNYVSNKHKKNW